jgi:serine/threonine protein kinase
MDIISRPLTELRNNYWMIQKLGCGGFGKVYLIKHRETKEFRAAKHQKWTSTDVPKLVRREVLVLRKLLNKQVRECNIYLKNYISYASCF